jgi:hypothetical protein
MHWGQDSCNKSDGPGRILFLLLASMLAHIVSGCAFASAYTTYRGTPSNYRVLLKGLKPGDHLQLAPGDYKEGLPVHHLHGTPDARITITISGSNEKNRPIFLARPDHSTISILNSGYIVIADRDFDGSSYDMKRTGAYAPAKKAPWWLPVLKIKPVPATHEKPSILFFD